MHIPNVVGLVIQSENQLRVTVVKSLVAVDADILHACVKCHYIGSSFQCRIGGPTSLWYSDVGKQLSSSSLLAT